MSSSRLILTPFSVEVDGVRVDILEVMKLTYPNDYKMYIVSCRIRYKGITSRIFPLFVKNEQDLFNKLKVEVTKVKFLELAYGLDEVRRVIS